VDHLPILERVHASETGHIAHGSDFLNHSLVHPKRHLLLHHVSRYLQFAAQLLRTHSCLAHTRLVEVVDEHCLYGGALEVELAVGELKSEVDVAQVVVEKYFAESFNSGVVEGVVLKHAAEVLGELERCVVLVVNGPVALRYSQTVQLSKV